MNRVRLPLPHIHQAPQFVKCIHSNGLIRSVRQFNSLGNFLRPESCHLISSATYCQLTCARLRWARVPWPHHVCQCLSPPAGSGSLTQHCHAHITHRSALNSQHSLCGAGCRRGLGGGGNEARVHTGFQVGHGGFCTRSDFTPGL